MSIIHNLIYYAALFFFVIFFGKQLINLFFTNKNNRDSNYSDPKEFDRLVEQKAQHLRLSLELEKKSKTMSEEPQRVSNQTSTTVLRTHDSKYLKNLLEDLNWGEGQELKNLRLLIEKKLTVNIALNDLTADLKEFLQNSKTIDFLNSHPALYPHLSECFLSYFYLKLGSEKKLSFNKISPSMERSFALMILLQVKSLMEIIVDLEKLNLTDQLQKVSRHTISQIIIKLLFKPDLPYFTSIFEFENKIKLLMTQSLYLDVLPTIKGNDKESALKLFGLKEMPKKEQLKSIYKDLAMTCHPDRLAPGSPELLKKLASQNFVNLNLAYELLQKGIPS